MRSNDARRADLKRDARVSPLDEPCPPASLNGREAPSRAAESSPGGGAHEAPQVFHTAARDVLACHERTIKVEEILTPRVVVMAGSDVDDPYQD